MIRKVLFILFLSCLSLSAQGEMDFNFDYARFNADSATVYLELYYSFNQDDLKRIEIDNEFYVEAQLSISMKKADSGEELLSKQWNIPQKYSEVQQEKNLVGVLGLYVEAGDYQLHIAGADKNNPDVKKAFDEKISVHPFDKNKLQLSDIQLSTKIIRENANSNSIFFKNNLEVIPNPQILFSETMPVLYYYLEVYNIKNGSTDNIVLENNLFNSNGVVVYDKKEEMSRQQPNILKYGFINLQKYPTDTYNFEIKVRDNANKEIYASSKKFYLYNPKVATPVVVKKLDLDFVSSEFANMAEEECDDIFKKSSYIASREENKAYGSLETIENKREFLFKFWTARDNNLNTPQNETKDDYFKRVAYSDENFSSFSLKGWKTDRGRIYIMYGKPDQVDRYVNRTDTKPYEIWYYNDIEAGVQFIFADYTGFSSYELIHSNKLGEVFDPDWTSKISLY
ncbi:MAG: GWxTD domain-containing protein [Melioribacteraceae bacterium]|nr:GWxTD domain-containing protein [Melioribacteraceae bacterium]